MAMTEQTWKIETTGPLGINIAGYDRSQPPQSQDGRVAVNQTFIDAMIVREEVFVVEQGVPLENELDDDDASCIHLVLYASDKPGTTSGRPAGTIRIVPQSSSLHVDFDQHRNLDGSVYTGDMSESNFRGQPFIKLGRLAVIKSQRGQGYANILVQAALDHAAANPASVVSGSSADNEEDKWTGLVLIHAQKQVQHFWAKAGFVVDEALGMWNEEGIDHVAMWKQIQTV